MRSWSVVLFALVVLVPLTPIKSSADVLKSYRDRLFSYPKTLRSDDGGAYRVIDYQELRDINRRDEVPERRVKRAYVDYSGRRATKIGQFASTERDLTYYYVGRRKGAKIITAYIHGKGGTGKQGINDFSFGGNFNRIKMLMLKNNGLYLSPDAGDFTAIDLRNIEGLLKEQLSASPTARLILACGSAGGEVCYQLAKKPALVQRLGGVVLLGSFWNDAYVSSDAGRTQSPVYVAHGSRDPIFDIAEMEAFYKRLRRSSIPVRMIRFETGTHGTPIRMIDWREAINWILAH